MVHATTFDEPGLTRDEQELLDCCIDGVSDLDVLVTLRREPRRRWRARELAEQTGLGLPLVRDAIARLCARGLADEADADAFGAAPLEATAHAAFDHLAGLWRARRHLLVEHVSRLPRRWE